MIQAFRFIIVLSILTGVLYTGAITVIAQKWFPFQANGSIVYGPSGTTSSLLIAHAVTNDQYFWPRPSATTPSYNASASGGSNLSPTNPAWQALVSKRVNMISDTAHAAEIPADMVMASGSGLDPHISIANARIQLFRVATARGVSSEVISALVDSAIETPPFRWVGPQVVNVNKLNILLDRHVQLL
jgi:K+-transporting ATPase ATPase C chain